MVTLADTSEQEAYRAATEACALVDRSERGKLALAGPEAKEFLHGQVTNDIERLEPGGGCYAAFLTHKGKMLGDLRVLDTGDELLLDCERVALQELFNMIRRFKLGRDVELHKRTVERGLRLNGSAGRGDVLRKGEREVGRLGSVVESPRFGPLALALVRREAEPGDVLAVGDGEVLAEVAALPFQQA
jgi:folate-binding Fe-S cluster repair protein YgfZ